MGVVTAQILILVLGVVLTLLGWMLITRAAERFSLPGNALLSQILSAMIRQSRFNRVPMSLARVAAPPRAPPALSLQKRTSSNITQ